MPRSGRLIRKSYFVDPRAVQRARKALRVTSEAEAVRQSVEHVAEMEAFWRFMAKSRGTLKGRRRASSGRSETCAIGTQSGG